MKSILISIYVILLTGCASNYKYEPPPKTESRVVYPTYPNSQIIDSTKPAHIIHNGQMCPMYPNSMIRDISKPCVTIK